MAIRSFFDIRSSIPGYVFVLWVILLNLESVLYFSNYIIKANEPIWLTFFIAIFGFITILGGAAIGFLISQFWFPFYHLVLRRFLEKWYFDNIELDKKKFKKKEYAYLLQNYIVHTDTSDQLYAFIVRRWDVFNTLGSTSFALIIAYIIGIIGKCLFKIPDSFKLEVSKYISICKLEQIIFVFTVILIILMIYSAYGVIKQNMEMTLYLIRLKLKSNEEETGQKKYVSDYYLDDIDPTTNS